MPKHLLYLTEALARLKALENTRSEPQSSACFDAALALRPIYKHDSEYASALGEDRGTIIALADTLTSDENYMNYTLEQVKEVREIIQRIHDSKSGILAKTTAPATRRLHKSTAPALLSPGAGSASIPISSVVQGGQSYFTTFVEAGQNAVAKQATCILATVLTHCFAFIRNKHHTADEHAPAIKAIAQVLSMRRIRTDKKNGKLVGT